MDVLVENINNAAYRIAAKYGKSILSEGSEEYLQEILQPVIRNLAFDEDNEFRLISEDAAYAGLMGALTAGVFESGNIVRGENAFRNEAVSNVSGARNPTGEKAKIHAYKYYNLVRAMRTDVEKISKATGFSEQEINAIKNFVFFEKHDLGNGRKEQFEPDFMMAESWKRLISGNPEKHDITLINHELMEKSLMSQGYTQEEAHIITSKKYNYAKEAKEYYDKIKKYKG